MGKIIILWYNFINEKYFNWRRKQMSIIGMGIMWAFAIIVFLIITRWPMGEEYDRRKAYWAKFEVK
jgi:hypothetical protein